MGLLTQNKAEAQPIREAGGDNEVPRDHLGRPRIIIACPGCDGSGRIPSEKRVGNTVKCPKACGPTKNDPWIPVGKKAKSYTRTTTFIDVIEDKSNLMAWKARMTLIGAATDPSLLDGVLGRDQAEKVDKDWLTRRAELAAKAAGAEDKADRGTYLHALSELRDEGKLLPETASFEDIMDMEAYMSVSRLFDIKIMERLMVLDEYHIGGTPDRVSKWRGLYELVTPDGKVIEPDDLLITDLKTGTTEYGQLKMAMQLAIYAHSKLYDFKTGGRSPLGNIRQDWGVIMNVKAGSGEAILYWADLTMGWEAVQVARTIRALRSQGKKALTVLSVPAGV